MATSWYNTHFEAAGYAANLTESARQVFEETYAGTAVAGKDGTTAKMD